MVTQTGKVLQTASPDQTSCMFGVPGMKTKNSHKQKKRRTMSWDEDHEDDDNDGDGDEPAGMSGALSSSRKGGGSSPIGTYKRKGKESSSRSSNKKKGGAGIAQAYVKDVGKKGVKKRKQGYLDQSNSGFDVPLTKEEKKRRKEREMRFQANDPKPAPPEPPSAFDAVYSALSARRGDVGSESSSGKKKKRKGKGYTETNGGTSFVGTNPILEKQYLRLTTFPKAEDVRPLPVLKRALQHIKARFHTEEDFEWANEQLKSVRQDITVQGIRNSFVLEVYETHARLALEEGELNEFNQCQTKIKELTFGAGEGGDSAPSTACDGIDVTPSKKKRKGRTQVKLLKQDEDVADEFAGYRLLYALVQKNWADVTKELSLAMAMMNAEDRRVEEEKERDDRMSSCRHAMLVTKAVIHCDYHDFFVLYENAPHMSCYLMDFLLRRIRCWAYERVISAFRPTISVEYFRETLRFRDLEETRQFLKSSGASFVKESGGDPPFYVDCKESKNLCS